MFSVLADRSLPPSPSTRDRERWTAFSWKEHKARPELSWWTLSTTRPIWRRGDRPGRGRVVARRKGGRGRKVRRRREAASTLEKRSFTVVDATMIRGRHSPLLLFFTHHHFPGPPPYRSTFPLHFRLTTAENRIENREIVRTFLHSSSFNSIAIRKRLQGIRTALWKQLSRRD